MAKTTLYKKDAKLAIRFWAIESDCDGYWIYHGQLHGEETEVWTEIPEGLAGRSLDEQIESEVQSRINKQIQRGYKTTISEAEEQVGGGLNESGMPRPMLATPEKNVDADISDYFHQPKLNGHRCISEITFGNVRACSRNGKEIKAITEIFGTLQWMFLKREIFLDGELYKHGIPLQRIGSWVKKRQPETAQLQYWVYDIVDPSMTFEERQDELQQIFANISQGSNVILCPTDRGVPNKTLLLQKYRSEGYEGGILRDPLGLYETGKRSKGLVKVKHLEDDEFLVLGIKPSKDGWAILDCIAKNGKLFSVTAPGTVAQKKYVMEHQKEFEGKHVQVQYAELTVDGIPFHPVATMWRNKDDE